MKLVLLWDPENPQVHVHPIIQALRDEVDLFELTFAEIGHRTLPNGAFEIQPFLDKVQSDGLLWIEGGPLPAGLADCKCRTACWLINPHLELTFKPAITEQFQLCLTTQKTMTADESCRWLPLAGTQTRVNLSPGIHFIAPDPFPGEFEPVLTVVDSLQRLNSRLSRPLVVCPSQNSQPNPVIFDCLASGIATVVGEETDLRDVAFASQHLITYPSVLGLPRLLTDLVDEPSRINAIARQAPAIITHLHTPKLRAQQLVNTLWPQHRVLSGSKAKPVISILTYCFKYMKRFRHYLDSLVHQNLGPGLLEIVVVDPNSPDGLKGHLESLASQCPQVRLVWLPIAEEFHRNRGVCINRAFDACSGKTIISTDGDILFPPTLVGELAHFSEAHPSHILGVRRHFLNRHTTEAILSGQVAPATLYERPLEETGDGEPESREGILGYCQVVQRKAFAKARYPEEFDRVNQSDIEFVTRLGRYANVQPHFFETRKVLHMWHPRDWSGTQEFL